MRRRMVWLVLLSLALLLCGGALFGGSGFTLQCTDEKCGYEGRVNFGGGFNFNQLTGYCANCQQFVYLRWPSGRFRTPVKEGEEPAKIEAPKPLGTIWDPATGREGTLYACPKCAGPVLAVKSADDVKCCPKCHQPNLKTQLVLAYD